MDSTALKLHMRPAALEDVEAVVALKNLCAVMDGGEADESLNDTRHEWSRSQAKLETNHRVVEGENRAIIGYAEIDDDTPQMAWMDVYVHPDHEQDGFADELVAWCESRARDGIGAAPADARVVLRAWTYANDLRFYQPLLVKHGLKIIRRSYRMIIDLDHPIDEPLIPEGIIVRTAVPGQDERAALETIRASFRDHFGYIERDFEDMYRDWWDHWRHNFQPELWWLAFAGDELVGVCLCENHFADDETIGWVSTLGVKREYRKQGLGRALLLMAFREFAKRGKRSVGLGVDGSSLTGAVRLYESAGMRVWRSFDLLEKELRSGVDYSTTALS